jgi:ubiquinol-cytochrome c reductase cytochrome b subunit
MNRIGQWFDERLGIFELSHAFLDRKVPGNINWFHTLGSATLILIGVQFLTGIALSMSYVPSPDYAYESVLYIDQTPFGGITRAIHRASAGLLVLLVGLHALRVFIWGAHKYPRELSWIIGALLMFVIMGFAFTGYLLPWDQKAYWATVVGTNIAGSAPFIGGGVLELLRGGEALGAVSLTRFYGIHVWVLPATLLGLVGLHLFMVIRQGIAATPRRKPLVEPEPGESRQDEYRREYAAEKEAGKPFWSALLKDALVGLIVVIVVLVAAMILGAPLEEPADPNATAYVPRPEWYFLDMYQLLWYITGPAEPLLIFLIFTAGALLFVAVPLIDRGRARHPRQRPAAMAGVVAVIGGVLIFTYMGAIAGPSVPTIPPTEGMTVTDLSGLAVFNDQGCASCHSVGGLGGTSGPDLSRAGARWSASHMREYIVIPEDDEMPSFDKLTDQQLDDLVSFLKTLE